MEAEVEFLHANLNQLMLYDVKLTADEKSELEQLINELGKFQEILKEASIKYERDERFKHWEKQIREVVYDIEDTIDTCVTFKAAETAMNRKHFQRLFRRSRNSLAEEVEKLRRTQLQPLLHYTDFRDFNVAEAPHTTVAEAIETSHKKTRTIVGFEAEANDFINFSCAESSRLEIASIVGMGGLGKTTLAWKIFEDPRIKYEFPVRIWVNISDILNMQTIILNILRKFTYNPPVEPIEELITKVKASLKESKFLMILDDIWTKEAWNKVKEILPMGNQMGRVLVITRVTDVALYSSARKAYYLRRLTVEESWELLQYEVYGELNIASQDLMGIGKDIAEYCDGYPPLLVVIGGILREKSRRADSNVSSLKKEWEQFFNMTIKPYLYDGDLKRALSSLISLRYENIPHEMRNCFLYLGVFPEDVDIPVKELIRLWIAEGFILESGGKSLEEVALAYLKEFINKNFLIVKEKKLDGEPKTCHILDSIREVCKVEACFENLNFFQEITRSPEGFFEPRCYINKCRRLSIHSHILDFLKNNKEVSRTRSFLSFNQTPTLLKPDEMATVTGGFGLLRVYNAKNIKFFEFPKKNFQLIHLRYLILVIEQCTSIPEAISDLLNLQTFIVDISWLTLNIEADIWKMRQLRHFNSKASVTLREDMKGEGGEKLQTFTKLAPECCTNQFFEKAKNLVTLGIQGELNKLASSEGLGKLERLHKLKLVNELPYGVLSENPLRRLPDSQSFPPNLKILVISGTYISWTKMSILSQLGCLEVLKLKENAYTGSYWECFNVFHRLEQLSIERSTRLVTWKATGDAFPKLRFLFLNNCEKLIEVPFAACENLEMLCIERVTKDLVTSSEGIAEYKIKQGKVFSLQIAPKDKIHEP